MTARAVRLSQGWQRWAMVCPDCRIDRPVHGSRETAEHVAALHNDTHHKDATTGGAA